MRLGPLNIQWGKKDAGLSIDSILRRIDYAYETFSGITVTPENCMMSPTVNAIVTAISRRISVLPVKVMQASMSDGRVRKEHRPSHPVQKLLDEPNWFQDRTSFWLDATSTLVRYGNVFHYKSRGRTGPIRALLPLAANAVDVMQDEEWNVTYRATLQGGGQQEYTPGQILHARGPARNGIRGDSPVMDIREAIGLEITAERMGASLFGNSALPGLVFSHQETSRGFETEEEERAFVEGVQRIYAERGRFKSMVVPYGMKLDTIGIENEKAQFLDTRQYQRTVIAGAFGVPPHMVGDLSRGTFNNVEQQSLDFVVAVVLPYVKIFESALERSLLTPDDRRSGVIIRFNIDAALRGDFKSRQEGLKIQREMGVINPNDWREFENMNPISREDGGETYFTQGPSGQGSDGKEDEPDPDVPDVEEEDGGEDERDVRSSARN